jgi:hypothetical protein
MSQNGFAMLDEKAQEEMNNVLAPFTRAWEKYEIISIALDHTRLLEILAAEFARDDARDGEEREDEERYDDAQEWIALNMAGAFLGPDAPVILVSGDSL